MCLGCGQPGLLPHVHTAYEVDDVGESEVGLNSRIPRAVADEAVAVVATTVLLSVLAHGVSAAPLAARYGRTAAAAGPEPGGPVDVIELRPGAAARSRVRGRVDDTTPAGPAGPD